MSKRYYLIVYDTIISKGDTAALHAFRKCANRLTLTDEEKEIVRNKMHHLECCGECGIRMLSDKDDKQKMWESLRHEIDALPASPMPKKKEPRPYSAFMLMAEIVVDDNEPGAILLRPDVITDPFSDENAEMYLYLLTHQNPVALYGVVGDTDFDKKAWKALKKNTDITHSMI